MKECERKFIRYFVDENFNIINKGVNNNTTLKDICHALPLISKNGSENYLFIEDETHLIVSTLNWKSDVVFLLHKFMDFLIMNHICYRVVHPTEQQEKNGIICHIETFSKVEGWLSVATCQGLDESYALIKNIDIHNISKSI